MIGDKGIELLADTLKEDLWIKGDNAVKSHLACFRHWLKDASWFKGLVIWKAGPWSRNKEKFRNNSEIDTLISKKLSVENKAKLSINKGRFFNNRKIDTLTS